MFLSVAKLASAAAKPDGVKVVSVENVPAFMADVPVRNLPGCGNLTEKLNSLGCLTAKDVTKTPIEKLRLTVGPALATRIQTMASGMDDSPVEFRPPRSIQSQMSLTSKPLPHPDPIRRATGETIKPVMGGDIQAVTPHLKTLVDDIGERLMDDYEEHSRWPCKLCVTATVSQHYVEGNTVSSRVSLDGVSTLRPHDARLDVVTVQAAILRSAMGAAEKVMRTIDAKKPVVKLNLKAENFESASRSDRPVTDFFQSPKAKVSHSTPLPDSAIGGTGSEVVKRQGKQPTRLVESMIRAHVPPSVMPEAAVRMHGCDLSRPLDLPRMMMKQVSNEITAQQFWEALNDRHLALHGFRMDDGEEAKSGTEPEVTDEDTGSRPPASLGAQRARRVRPRTQ